MPRGAARTRSLNADAFHSVEALCGPAIIGCTAKFQGDDCVNIHGTYHFVAASEGAVLRVTAPGNLTIEPGDPVEFLPFAGERPADAVAVKIEPDGGITEVEKDFVRKLRINDQNRARLLEGKAAFFKVTLNRAVPLPMGSAVCSGRRVGNGFAVKDCDFGYNRSRGILIKASHGVVSGNRIARGWIGGARRAGVLVVRGGERERCNDGDNVITGCRQPAIEVLAQGGNNEPLPSGAHRDIRITGNVIRQSAWPNIRVTSTTGLVLTGNQLTEAEPDAFVPPLESRWPWGKVQPSAILVTEP